MAIADRYRGCLLGLSCGDALGGPMEFQSRHQVAASHPNGLRNFIGGGCWNLAPGEITDDAQMTIALARSLAHGGPLDMEDVGREFLVWVRTYPKDIGNQMRAALTHLAAGIAWDDAGNRIQRAALPKGAAGNGSVMRCAPVALRFRNDSDGLVHASIADPGCTWAAVAVNQAIVHLLNGGSRSAALDAAIAGTRKARVVDAITAAARITRDEIRSGGYVLDTVTAALWALLAHDSLDEIIVAAVSLGDDADTTGAVAGALAGAHYCASALPGRWLSMLHPRVELEILAHRLLILNQGGS